MDSLPLKGRVGIVTGGSRGIGGAVSTLLAEDGATVAVLGLPEDRARTEHLAARLNGAASRLHFYETDVGIYERCKEAVAAVLREHGRIDFLVNNAGITRDHTVRKMTVEEWQAVLQVNLSGPFFMIKAVLDTMLEQGFGRIVNVSSVVGVDRKLRAGELRRRESRADRIDEDGRARSRQAGHHGQRGRAGLHRHRHDEGDAVGSDRKRDRADAQAPARPTGRGRARGAVARSTKRPATSRARSTTSTADGTCDGRDVRTRSMAPEELSYGIDVTGLDPASLTDALRAVIADVMMDPMRMSTWLTGLGACRAERRRSTCCAAWAARPPPTPAIPRDDKRFAEPEWSTNPILAGLVEDYRARTQAALQLVDSARLPEATRRKARFAMQLMCDAFAPSNVPWLNPGVVKEATEIGRAEPRARSAKLPRTTSRTTAAIRAKSTAPASSWASTSPRRRDAS